MKIKKTKTLKKEDVLSSIYELPSVIDSPIDYRRGYNDAIFKAIEKIDSLKVYKNFLIETDE